MQSFSDTKIQALHPTEIKKRVLGKCLSNKKGQQSYNCCPYLTFSIPNIMV